MRTKVRTRRRGTGKRFDIIMDHDRRYHGVALTPRSTSSTCRAGTAAQQPCMPLKALRPLICTAPHAQPARAPNENILGRVLKAHLSPHFVFMRAVEGKYPLTAAGFDVAALSWMEPKAVGFTTSIDSLHCCNPTPGWRVIEHHWTTKSIQFSPSYRDGW